MRTRYLANLKDRRLPESIGNKARNLRRLAELGFQVPVTYVCTWDAYLQYLADDVKLVEDLRRELVARLDPNRPYALRSSANFEDHDERSFAGQFKSVLHVQGVDQVLQAMWSIWATTQAARVQAYLEKMAIPPGELKMAVVIQEMVHPEVSGVAFSKNPTTGMSEIVVEAVRGSGEALVQEGVTPARWIYRWGQWALTSQMDGIQLNLIQEVVEGTAALAKKTGHQVDLEWVYDGQALYWVQLREITTLHKVEIYSNKISREVMPGLIKPLIWSINVPLVNQAWIKLLTELIGANDLEPERLAKPFYYRSYFNVSALGQVFNLLGLPEESLELMMGINPDGPKKARFKPTPQMLKRLPRLLRFVFEKANFAPRLERFLPELEEKYRRLPLAEAGQLSEQQLLDRVDELFGITNEAAYYNIVVPLLMAIYNQLLRRQLRRAGVDFEQFDLLEGLESIKEYDPAYFLSELKHEFLELDETSRQQILRSSYAEFQQLPGIGAFQERFTRFIDRFGHLSDSGNDFSSRPWREDPEFTLRMAAEFVPLEHRAAGKVRFEQVRLPFVRRWLVGKLYKRALQFRLYREQISSRYTYGYGLFRVYFLALGRCFVRRGLLCGPDDIFYLSQQEIRQAVTGAEPQPGYAALVARRKEEMEQVRDVLPPHLIYGDQAPPANLESSLVLSGTPTSRGCYTGPVKVVCGLADFHKVREGDILVIPYSDVGWAPLFVKAGGVVSESGGLLSHSSIIAREYNIPAVVSIPNATRLLHDGELATVDGYKGEVTIHP